MDSSTGSGAAKPVGPYLPAFGSEVTQPVLTGLTPLVPGALIAGRYRLNSLIGKVGAATRWSGVDEGLSRPVTVTAFANDEHTLTILESARMASGAMDARFLRILDAGQDADGAYIVSEWADGPTMTQVLQRGPLTGEESAWVIREVATALASVHALHLYHCRLDPNQISICPGGTVKIAGLRIDQALMPRAADDELTRQDMETLDVMACGALLYACLTATWPGSINVGLEPAPRSEDGFRSPANVRPGTSPALDQLTRRIMSPRDPEHITTARGIEKACTAILGSKDPTAALSARIAAPDSPVARAATTAKPPAQAERPRILPASDQDLGTESSATVQVGSPVMADMSDTTQTETSFTSSMPAESPSSQTSHDKPVPLQHPIPPEKSLIWSKVFLVLIAVVVVTLISCLIVGLYHLSSSPSEEQTPPAPTLTSRPITNAIVFDSIEDGGSQFENDDQAPLAYDGNPGTAWMTEVYERPIIPQEKPGVGLVFDLGAPVGVSQAVITVQQRPIAVTIYVPSPDPATVTEPDLTTVTHWTAVTNSPLTDPTTTIDFDSVTTRYVLVYITQVIDLGDGKTQADLAEVSFAG